MARVCVCPKCETRWTAGVSVDPARHAVSWDGRTVALKRMEARLLGALVGGYGRVVSREALVAALWGDDPDGGPECAMNGISVLMHGLRRRLASAGFPGAVRTWPRSGYELVLAA